MRNPYLSHKLVDKQPLTNGNDDASPTLLFCTIFWQINLKIVILYTKQTEIINLN